MNGFKGVLFTLKKRMQNPNRSDNEHYKYVVFGYYDGLDINCVEQWYELRPKGLMRHKSIVELSDPFIDQYTIKALFPENTTELEKKGFSYSLFEKIGDDKFVNEYNEYPFIAMSLINISEDFVRRYKGLDELNVKMFEFVESSLLKFSDSNLLKCAVFPSIGYSDYIVVFLSSDFEQVAPVIDDLRTKHFDDRSVPFSSCYTVCGFYKNADVENLKNNASVHLSVRVNLGAGIAAKYFMEKFKIAAVKEFKENGLKDEEIQAIIKNWEKEYYSTFDNSDSLFLPEYNLYAYLPLYLDDHILNPGHHFFKSHIMNIRTSIRVNGEILNQCQCNYAIDINNKREIINAYLCRFQEFITNYEKYIAENNLQIRISKSLQQLMKNFLNISQLSHCFDAEKILGKAFDSLIENMEYVFEHADLVKAQDVEETLNEFRNAMGSYLSDIIRSDKLFIEGQTLTHPSIGSATKLLFAYNSIINTFVGNLIASEKNPIGRFTFLIISGGCDKTTAADLFEFLGIQTECSKLIIITVPEMSLYDVKGTLFRIGHECMHFCGERKRKDRYKHLVKALANTTARNLVNIIYSEDEFYLLLHLIEPYFDLGSNEYQELEIEMHSIFNKYDDKLAKEISDYISTHTYFTKYGYDDKTDESLFYLLEIENDLLRDINVASVFLSEDMLNRIYDLIMQAEYDKLKDMIECVSKYGVIYSELNTLLIQKKYIIRYGKKSETMKGLVDTYFNLYMGDLKCPKEFEIMRKYVQEYGVMRSEICYAMREGFADCSAVKILGIKFADFILGFIYEKWNVDETFPETERYILRIGADLKIAFGITGTLSDTNKNAIREKAKYWKERGYEYKNIEQLIERLDCILANYEALGIFKGTEEIEDYLQECMLEFQIEKFQDIQNFCKISDIVEPKDTYVMMDYLIRQWEGLSDE